MFVSKSKLIFILYFFTYIVELNSSIITNSDKFVFNVQCIRAQKCNDTDKLETYIHPASTTPCRNTNNGDLLYYGPIIDYTVNIPDQEWWKGTNNLNAFNLTNYFRCNYSSYLIFTFEKYSNSYTNIGVIISNNGVTGFTQNVNWAGEEAVKFWVYNVLGGKFFTTNRIKLIVHCPPDLYIRKNVESISLNGITSKAIPGATIEYVVYYSNGGIYDGYGTNAVIYDKLISYICYVSNSSKITNNWQVEWSTNSVSNQDWGSTDYTTNEPPGYNVKWIRWKKTKVLPGESGKFYFKVVVK